MEEKEISRKYFSSILKVLEGRFIFRKRVEANILNSHITKFPNMKK